MLMNWRIAISSLMILAAMAAARMLWLDPGESPRSSAVRIGTGLEAERALDFPTAERELLEAARLDRQYLPAWTLANFYFRRGDATRFWPWAQRAAAMSYDDPGPLLQLADPLDPGRALDHLQTSPQLERAYLDLLIHDNRIEAAQAVARRILARGEAHDVARLRAFTTRLIAANRGADAAELWYRVGDDSLDHPPSGEGFDWRLPNERGVTAASRVGVLDFALDGLQSDVAALLERVIDVDHGTYRLSYQYSTDAAGLHWALGSIESPPLAPAPRWRESEQTFAPAHAGLVHLVLLYRREAGMRRAEGRVEIRNVRFTRL
jgi:hypothetical protein